MKKHLRDEVKKVQAKAKPKARAPKSTEIPTLSFTRGKLDTYRMVKKSRGQKRSGRMLVDQGFNRWAWCLACDVAKVTVTDTPDYTYVAVVEKVIDGDTLWVEVDCGFHSITREKLRLRGIDCPELSTPEGKRAKRFVKRVLDPCDFIIIKTHKDQTGKFGRYIADIFYPSGDLRDSGTAAGMTRKKDPQKIADTGTFLNQELLDKGLAKMVKD